MNLKNIKLQFFYLRKSFFQYKKGFEYVYYKHILAPKILKINKVLEKPINNNDLSIHILTCHKDLVITVWSLASFYNNIELSGQLFIHNDGSLNSADQDILKKFFPNSKIINPNYLFEKYSDKLDAYPMIKKFRLEFNGYFLLKKLIDPYFISDKKIRLVIDSDLLWFFPPTEIIDAINGNGIGSRSLMMKNNRSCYIYFNDGKLNDDLASFNSGIVLYSKADFNLDKLSDYLSKIDIENKENAHFIEQAGYAYCLNNLISLPENLYTIKDKVEGNTVVKHYTSPRRPLFFIEGLKNLKNKLLK